MPSQDHPEADFDPRHRIVGAVVVVSLLVVLAPLVLNKQQLPQEPAPLAAGSRVVVTSVREMDERLQGRPDDAPAETAPAGQAAAPGDAVEAAAAAPSSAEEVVPQPSLLPPPKAKSEPEPVARPVASKPAGNTPAPKAATSAGAGGWVVQVGTYANRDNVKRLEKRLKGKGYAVLLESVRLKNGEALRVRVGPFGEKSAASSASERIQRELGLKGVVLAAK